MLSSFILGVCAALLAFFAQIFFTLFIGDTESLNALLFFTAIEESVRFCILFFASQREAIPQHIPAVALIFGSGFALTEAMIAQDFSAERLLSLFLVHILLSLCILVGTQKRNLIFPFATFLFALALHLLYNAHIWFARF